MIDLSRNKMYVNRYKTTPITVATFLVTEKCNLACKYCFEPGMGKKETMTKEVVQSALKFLFNNANTITDGERKVGVTLFGGEPTLVPDIIEEIFEYGCLLRDKYKIPFSVDMITNATMLPDKLYNIFAKYRDEVNFSVQLSVDGIEEVQNMYRVTKSGKGSYHLVDKTIPKYKKLFKDSPRQLSIHGCSNKKTLPYLYENYMFFKYKLGLNRIWFLPVMEEEWDDNDVELYKTELGKIYNHVMEIVKRENSIDEVEHYAPLDRCKRGIGKQFRPNKPCGAGTNYCTITAKGELYPCHQIYFKDSNNDTLIGNIYSGADDDRRRLFLEYDSNDLSCPNDCDHAHCYRCIAVNWVLSKSILTQKRGNYCDIMKVDQYYQIKMRGELETMGLLNKDDSSTSDCLCDTRGNDEGNCSCDTRGNISTSACLCDLRGDLNDSEDECGQHSDSVNDGMCDVVTRSESCLVNKISESETFINPNQDTIKKSSNLDSIETWIKDNVKYEKFVNNDGSVSIKDTVVIQETQETNNDDQDNCKCESDCNKDSNELTINEKEVFSLALKSILIELNIMKKMISDKGNCKCN